MTNPPGLARPGRLTMRRNLEFDRPPTTELSQSPCRKPAPSDDKPGRMVMQGKGPGAAVSLGWIGAALGRMRRRTGESVPMDGISLTRMARAALLPAVIGMSAAGPARGDDPVAVRRRLDRLRVARTAIDPGPGVVRRHPEPHELQRQARPDRPGFSRAVELPPAVRPVSRSSRHPIADIAVLLVAQAGGAGPSAPRSGLAGTSGRRADDGPIERRPTVPRRSSRRPRRLRRPAGDAALRRTQAGART